MCVERAKNSRLLLAEFHLNDSFDDDMWKLLSLVPSLLSFFLLVSFHVSNMIISENCDLLIYKEFIAFE